MQPKLILAFERLSEPDFDTKSNLIVTSLKGNSNFPLPWPPPTPQLADVTAAADNYHALFVAGKSGDHETITKRDVARDILTQMLKKVAPYLEVVADGSVSMLQTTGYDLRHDIVKGTTPDPLPAPANFRFMRGELSGTMVNKAESLAGAGSYQLQICTGDPSIEANWKDHGTFKNCSNIITDGYTPGVIYFSRLRGIGSNGPGVWAVSPGVMAV
jgi:hypothetical protein